MLIREKVLNKEKFNYALVEMEMNISKQQEDRLEADLLATKKQKEDLIA